MLKRKKHLNNVLKLISTYKIVGILGARQVGKTTLARMLVNKYKRPIVFFDLENPEDLARLQDPMLALKNLKGLIVIDEVQRAPDLFTVLRVLADRPRTPARFLILGSASPSLLRQSSETLAGRIIYYNLGGFSLEEVDIENFNKLWLRGGFPRSYLAKTHTDSLTWRRAFIQTFLERDLPQLGINVRSTTLRRFWQMLAHYHGQIWNASEFGRSFGVADTTVRNYLDILSSTLVVRQLLPWRENIAKRQKKSPKIYISDSGLLHGLLNLKTVSELEGHPKLGASWEGFIINEIIEHTRAKNEECFFWATHNGAELDLLLVKGSQKLGFEIKRTSSPKITPSMKISLKNLNLKELFVIHAGEKTFNLTAKIKAISYKNLLENIKPFT